MKNLKNISQYEVYLWTSLLSKLLATRPFKGRENWFLKYIPMVTQKSNHF